MLQANMGSHWLRLSWLVSLLFIIERSRFIRFKSCQLLRQRMTDIKHHLEAVLGARKSSEARREGEAQEHPRPLFSFQG
jgi:hypothetical protein